MKKTILSLFAAFMALSASAQRHADLELTVIAPVDSQVITKGDPFDLQLSFKNLGPDTIVLSDMLKVLFTYNGDTMGYGNNPHFYAFNVVSMPPGFSFPIHMGPIMNFTDALHKGKNKICLSIFIEGDSTNQIFDTVSSNNGTCRSVFMQSLSVASIPANNGIKVYPIPAKDVLNWETGNSQAKQVAVIDFTGKTVFSAVTDKNSGQIELNGFPKGLYMLRIIGKENSIYTNKIIVE